mmetsp:Transcript_14771/g.29728  ORF Transcript_14771/g.29728 Transcript_14771/m.29728 type:complete len:258 (+) Transcript_14771:1052-1825(+)
MPHDHHIPHQRLAQSLRNLNLLSPQESLKQSSTFLFLFTIHHQLLPGTQHRHLHRPPTRRFDRLPRRHPHGTLDQIFLVPHPPFFRRLGPIHASFLLHHPVVRAQYRIGASTPRGHRRRRTIHAIAAPIHEKSVGRSSGQFDGTSGAFHGGERFRRQRHLGRSSAGTGSGHDKPSNGSAEESRFDGGYFSDAARRGDDHQVGCGGGGGVEGGEAAVVREGGTCDGLGEVGSEAVGGGGGVYGEEEEGGCRAEGAGGW